jgi:hypothetical protein
LCLGGFLLKRGREMKRVLLGLVVVGVFVSGGLVGCAGSTVKVGSEISSANVDKIVKGKTTKGEILQTFGQPASITRTPYNGGETLGYAYTQGGTAINPAKYIPYAGLLVPTTGKTTTQMLNIDISKDGIVDDYNFSEHVTTASSSLLGGNSAQTIQTR